MDLWGRGGPDFFLFFITPLRPDLSGPARPTEGLWRSICHGNVFLGTVPAKGRPVDASLVPHPGGDAQAAEDGTSQIYGN